MGNRGAETGDTAELVSWPGLGAWRVGGMRERAKLEFPNWWKEYGTLSTEIKVSSFIMYHPRVLSGDPYSLSMAPGFLSHLSLEHERFWCILLYIIIKTGNVT